MNGVASYRLQLHAGFPLSAARAVLPYLADLGVSHVYLSPCLQAVPGSLHGYDVTDPTRISEDLGGEPAWSEFVAAARAHRLRILLDIVPNHMSASQYNPWWDSVLAHGPFSEFIGYFDIRSPPQRPFRVHLCSLARPYGAAIDAKELSIDIEQGALRVRHFETTWPLGPASWGLLLASAGALPAGGRACFEELARLQRRVAPDAGDRARYAEQAAQAQHWLAEAQGGGSLQAAVEHTHDDPKLLDAVLRRQFYRLHGWKLAAELGNYRRFFDVGALVGIRSGAARRVRRHACTPRRDDRPRRDRRHADRSSRRSARAAGVFPTCAYHAAAGPHLRRENPGER